MILVIKNKAGEEEIKKMSEEYGDYIKVVVDIEKAILAGGGERHFDAEQLLLDEGSKQENLWGGGFDLKTKEVDFNSMINLRPSEENPSREILSVPIREKFTQIVRELLF